MFSRWKNRIGGILEARQKGWAYSVGITMKRMEVVSSCGLGRASCVGTRGSWLIRSIKIRLLTKTATHCSSYCRVSSLEQNPTCAIWLKRTLIDELGSGL